MSTRPFSTMGTQVTDHYAILGVQRTATTAMIKTAYRKLALTCHPDKVTEAHLPASTAKFHEIKTAQDILIDPIKRAKHDQALRESHQRMKARAHGIWVPPKVPLNTSREPPTAAPRSRAPKMASPFARTFRETDPVRTSFYARPNGPSPDRSDNSHQSASSSSSQRRNPSPPPQHQLSSHTPPQEPPQSRPDEPFDLRYDAQARAFLKAFGYDLEDEFVNAFFGRSRARKQAELSNESVAELAQASRFWEERARQRAERKAARRRDETKARPSASREQPRARASDDAVPAPSASQSRKRKSDGPPSEPIERKKRTRVVPSVSPLGSPEPSSPPSPRPSPPSAPPTSQSRKRKSDASAADPETSKKRARTSDDAAAPTPPATKPSASTSDDTAAPTHPSNAFVEVEGKLVLREILEEEVAQPSRKTKKSLSSDKRSASASPVMKRKWGTADGEDGEGKGKRVRRSL